jgi:hypothetical protein
VNKEGGQRGWTKEGGQKRVDKRGWTKRVDKEGGYRWRKDGGLIYKVNMMQNGC